MENMYGGLDLTILGKLVRQHPELVRKVNFKDGEHQLINIDVFAKREQDQYGNVATVKASCKKENQREGLNYYLANLKVSQFQSQDSAGQHQQNNNATQAKGTAVDDNDGLPF